MFLLYEVALYLVFIIGLPFFLLAGLWRGKYLVNFTERLGFYRTPAAAHDLWIHAVSVGEAIAAKPVIDELLRRRPSTSIVLTTTTITGQAQARRMFPFARIAYFPFDFTASVRSFLDHNRPKVYAVMETEIWPNVTRLARRRGVRLLVANGRLSDRSYPRYRRFRVLVGPLLRQYDRLLAREAEDRERFIAIGAPPAIVEVAGNVKFDFTPDETPLAITLELEAMIAGRPVLMLASTVAGEDEMLIPLLRDDWFTIIAPRKPERFDAVAALLRGKTLVRRSELTGGTNARPQVLLLDSIGELARVYRHATAAFIGGSLVNTGGHNPIEAAAAGVPVCFGPHTSNFREIVSVFLRNDAAVEVQSAAEVMEFAERMRSDAPARSGYEERARKTVAQNRGAAALTAARILELLA